MYSHRLPPDRQSEIQEKFSSRKEKARDVGFVTGKKNGAVLLTKIAPLFINVADLPRLCMRCSMDTVCELCGLACGSFSLMGMNDRHLKKPCRFIFDL